MQRPCPYVHTILRIIEQESFYGNNILFCRILTNPFKKSNNKLILNKKQNTKVPGCKYHRAIFTLFRVFDRSKDYCSFHFCIREWLQCSISGTESPIFPRILTHNGRGYNWASLLLRTVIGLDRNRFLHAYISYARLLYSKRLPCIEFDAYGRA